VLRGHAVALSDPDFAPNTTFLDGLRRGGTTGAPPPSSAASGVAAVVSTRDT
jgi:hypothetical protein